MIPNDEKEIIKVELSEETVAKIQSWEQRKLYLTIYEDGRVSVTS